MKRVLVLSALAATFAFGILAAGALANDPPGRDPCSHGETGKQCKPDPQPDKGKDCEHHGKNGGQNEDHCKSTTTETTTTTTTQPPTTTETTTTGTTETTSPPPSTTTQETTNSSTPQTITTVEITTEQTTTEAVPPVETTEPPAQAPRTNKPPVAGPGTDVSEPQRIPRKGKLPHTGLSLPVGGLLGLGLLGMGAYLRRREIQ